MIHDTQQTIKWTNLWLFFGRTQCIRISVHFNRVLNFCWSLQILHTKTHIKLSKCHTHDVEELQMRQIDGRAHLLCNAKLSYFFLGIRRCCFSIFRMTIRNTIKDRAHSMRFSSWQNGRFCSRPFAPTVAIIRQSKFGVQIEFNLRISLYFSTQERFHFVPNNNRIFPPKVECLRRTLTEPNKR